MGNNLSVLRKERKHFGLLPTTSNTKENDLDTQTQEKTQIKTEILDPYETLYSYFNRQVHTFNDFEILKPTKYYRGKIYQAQKKDDGMTFTLRKIQKIKKLELDLEVYKKKIPFVVQIHWVFEADNEWFLIFDNFGFTEMFDLLQREKTFSEEQARFYVAEIVVGLSSMHDRNLYFGDLVPEDIRLDEEGHIILGPVRADRYEYHSGPICGSPEYLAPEALRGLNIPKISDWWSLGVIIFEMLTGVPPFYDENVTVMFKKIMNDEPGPFPLNITQQARTFIHRLLVKDYKERLGYKGSHEVKNDSFFSNINWDDITTRKIRPPFISPTHPRIDHSDENHSFDEFIYKPYL